MAVLTGTKTAEARARQLLSLVCAASLRRPRLPSGQWVPRARATVRLAGLLLVTVGLALGLGVIWIQLARALPLAGLLHHPRAVRAMLIAGAGLALLFLGRRGPASRSGRAGLPTRSRTGSIAVAAALVAAGAGPALAIDATGTWSGRWSCRQKAGATVTRTVERDSTMLLTQRGEALFLEIDGTAYQGRSHDLERHPRRAAGSAVRSTGDGEAFAHASEVLDLKIMVNDVRGKATIRAESTVQNALGKGHCNYRFSRTSREDPGVVPPPQEEEFCGDGLVNDAPNEECDGGATGTPCDGTCTTSCTCPRPCEPLDVSGHWEGTWVSEVTGDGGQVVANLGHEGDFVLGTISFPPFSDVVYSAPLVVIGACAPAEFSTGAVLRSGVVGTLDGIATNTSLAGTWRMSDGSDRGTWHMSR
jgi:hypothetical protein